MRSFPILELLQDSCDPPLTPAAIEALELQLGVRFPADYVEFLLQFNGGQFVRPVTFEFPRTGREGDRSNINSFLGHSPECTDCMSLVWNAEVVSDRFPDGFLAIADCISEDFVLLKLTGAESKFEGIWYWDGPGFWIPEDGPNIHWLADTLEDFLSMLKRDLELYADDYAVRETLPLFQSVERGELHTLEEFVRQGGKLDSRNARGQTLLAVAVIQRWPKIVRLLLECGANPNARDRKGRTPPHHAATHSIDSIKLLLAAGADAKARDNKGKSVLAQWSYCADQILRAHGAVE